MLTPDVIKMSVNDAIAIPQFVMHYLNSEVARRIMFGAAFGTTRLRVTLPLFRNMLVPLPSLEEQQVIVSVVDEQLSTIDAIECEVDRSLARSSRLRQSILKRAFEGNLVPQDPTDEPASELLARIKAEREASESPAKTRKPRRK